MTDASVVRTAYATAKSMGASDRVMLALFEAGIVESGFENLSGGDRDSVGYLQQRPSQGWPNPRDVPTATRSFVSKAMPIEGKYATSGQLAQAVQRSAFPLKYDAVRAQAATLLAQYGGSSTDVATMGNPISGATDTLKTIVETLSNPKMWIRIGLFGAGAFLLLVAVSQVLNSSVSGIVSKVT